MQLTTADEFVHQAAFLSPADRQKVVLALAMDDTGILQAQRVDVFGQFANVLSPVDVFLRRKRDDDAENLGEIPVSQ